MKAKKYVYVLDHVLMVYKTSEALFRENKEPIYRWEELVDGELWSGVYTARDGSQENVVVRRREVRE